MVFKNSTILRIPFFQRQYVWKKEQWERFSNDMESLVGLRNKYFLGSLIFKNEETVEEEAAYGVCEKYTVIDGQQRLTTLSIYLKAIDSLLEDELLHNNFKSSFFIQNGQRNPVLQHSINDRAAYQEVMWGNPTDAYQDKDIVTAYRYFRDKMSGKSQPDLKQLWMAIFARIKFVVIILDNQDDEQQIFDTINSLGVDLTIDELMKNFLYEVQDEEANLNNWKPVFDSEESRGFWKANDAARKQSAKDENMVISNFFYDFVRIKMWDYEGMPGFDKKAFVQKGQTFSTCKAFKEVFGTDKQVLANEIIEYAKLYKQYFNKKNLDIRIPMTPGIERIACIAMAKESTMIPYLLYVLRNVHSLEERNRIFGFLETYLVRRMACTTSGENKMASEFYPEQLIAKRKDSYDKLREYILAISGDKTMHMPSDEEIAANIHRITFDEESTPRLFFYLQETKGRFNAATGGLNYFVAEYIMPKPGNKAADRNYPPHKDEAKEQERKIKIKTLGNFLILQKTRDVNNHEQEEDNQTIMRKELKKALNAAFVDKKKVLCKYIDTVVCSNWFNKKTKWNESEIQLRNEGIASSVIASVWPL